MLTAAVDHPGHLTVDGIEAQPFVSVLLLFAWRFSRQGELQRLEETRLVVVQVCNGVHRHAALVGNEAKKNKRKTENLILSDSWVDSKPFSKVFLTLLRARGADSGVLGDDSLAVSDVELSDELLLDNSLFDVLLVANCRAHGPRFNHKLS